MLITYCDDLTDTEKLELNYFKGVFRTNINYYVMCRDIQPNDTEQNNIYQSDTQLNIEAKWNIVSCCGVAVYNL